MAMMLTEDFFIVVIILIFQYTQQHDKRLRWRIEGIINKSELLVGHTVVGIYS